MRLPVSAVTLFSSGVAHVQHEGEVAAGEVQVPLTFHTAQVKDVLKSLVLLDDGGKVLPAVYPSQDPIARTLHAFAVDVSANASRAELLQQLRGAPVRIKTQAGESYEGPLVSVEQDREWSASNRAIEFHRANVLTEEGLVSVPLDKVALLTLLDERLNRELREALGVLAASSDEGRRTITLTFAGETARRVQASYVTEAPLWKVSYRLVLGDEKPYLQGWALVENTSDEDWDGVTLSLVSGRPISFIQDLYQPLYLPRPVVGPDTIAAPEPQVHAGAMYDRGEIEFQSAPATAMVKHRAASLSMQQARGSVDAQATGAAAGEVFRYEIDAPVHLPRQQAAMIPIVTGDIHGEKLSLYNADVHARHPSLAVRLTNDTGLHLKAGPITLFDDGVYAGDARIEELPPTDSRIVTYAVDLAVEAERVEAPATMESTFSVVRGLLTATLRHRRETTYRLRNKAPKTRALRIEHPFRADWSLLAPESPAERTHDRYRFALDAPAGETVTLAVTEERTDVNHVALVSMDLDQLIHYTRQGAGELPARLREALNVTVARRRKAHDLDSQADEREKERAALHQEQERIRANLAATDKDSPLHKRYLAELDGQETRLAELRREAVQLRSDARAAREELKAFLESLEVSA